MRTFLFGYGSLLNSRSRNNTFEYHDGVMVPVVVRGLRRGWFVEDAFRKNTAVCVYKDDHSCTTGALLQIHHESLPEYDAREVGYDRVLIDHHRFEYLGGEVVTDDDLVYVYEPQEMALTTQYFPVTQSYLDIVLKGFLDISETFAAQFMETTFGWEKQLVNDRKQLWYPRGFSENDSAQRIDTFLRTYKPEVILNRIDADDVRSNFFAESRTDGILNA